MGEGETGNKSKGENDILMQSIHRRCYSIVEQKINP